MKNVRVFTRYVLIQVPGWILAAVVLSWLLMAGTIPAWTAAALYAGYILKDFILYPLLRRAYETDERAVLDALAGQTGVATQDLCPWGYIRIRGELWRAEAAPGSPPILKDSRVTVVSAEGLTLTVRPGGESD